MSDRDTCHQLIEQLPEYAVAEAVEELRAIALFYASRKPYAYPPKAERIKGRVRGAIVRPPLVLSD